MHDTAVGTANFTERMPAPTGRGKQVAGDRGRVDTEPTHRMQRRPPVVGGSASWHQNQRALARCARPVLGRGCGMIRFNNCLLATLLNVRKPEPNLQEQE